MKRKPIKRKRSLVPLSARPYPQPRRTQYVLDRLRRWTLHCMVFGFLTCLIVNVAVGGFPWCLYVFTGEFIFYVAFMHQDPADESFLQRFFRTSTLVCALLLLIEHLQSGSRWASGVAVPMTYLGMLCVSSLLYFLQFGKQKQNLLPYFEMVLGAVAVAILHWQMSPGPHWPGIALISYAGAMVVLPALLLRRPLWLEVRKKLRA